MDVLIEAGLEYRPGSEVIVLIEAGGFYSRKYGKHIHAASVKHSNATSTIVLHSKSPMKVRDGLQTIVFHYSAVKLLRS